MSPSSIEILAFEPTPLGTLCLRRRRLLSAPQTWVTEITLNHELLMSSQHTVGERALASRALDVRAAGECGGELSVLVGGLGLGYTAREALASELVARVEVVEKLPQVIDWLHRGWIPPAHELKTDCRFTVREGDIFQRLSAPPQRRYDVILIDVDHSPQRALHNDHRSFYTREGLQSAARHLASEGVLAVWSYAPHSPFAATLARVFTEVDTEPVVFHNHLVDALETQWLFLARL